MAEVEDLVFRDGPQVAEKEAIRLFSGIADPTQAGEGQLAAEPSQRSIDGVTKSKPVELDMGMGSRTEGFRACGCR